MSIPLTGGSANVGFTYDAMGRVSQRTIDTGNAVGPVMYDALGRLANITNPLASVSFCPRARKTDPVAGVEI
jgi:hypothetical protein